MLKERSLPVACINAATGFFFSLCLFFAAFCDSVNGEEREGTPTEGETMETMAVASKSHGSIPPIDAAAPAKTETATFALG